MITRPPSATLTDTLFPYPALFRSHRREEARVLKGAAEPAARPSVWTQSRHVLPAEHDATAVGSRAAREQVEQRGLPRAVGADDPEDLVVVQLPRGVVERPDAPEGPRSHAPPA